MPVISVDVDVELGDFDTEDLIDELENRGKHDPNTLTLEDRTELEAIHHLSRMRRHNDAYKRMYNYIRDKLGKAI
jgi:hypothetical protein